MAGDDLKIGQELAKHVFDVYAGIAAWRRKWLISLKIKWCPGKDSNLGPID